MFNTPILNSPHGVMLMPLLPNALASVLPTAFDADQRYSVDLHMHSTASDGALSPTDLVTLCAGRGLTHMALTDHDTMEGWKKRAAPPSRQGFAWCRGVSYPPAGRGLIFTW